MDGCITSWLWNVVNRALSGPISRSTGFFGCDIAVASSWAIRNQSRSPGRRPGYPWPARAAQRPVPAKASGQPDRARPVAVRDQAAERGVPVVLVVGELAEPDELVGAEQVVLSSDLSVSAVTRSSTRSAPIPRPAQTCTTASRVAPPVKTEKRCQSRRSASCSLDL